MIFLLLMKKGKEGFGCSSIERQGLFRIEFPLKQFNARVIEAVENNEVGITSDDKYKIHVSPFMHAYTKCHLCFHSQFGQLALCVLQCLPDNL